MDGRAEYFGVVLDRLTGKVRRIFNPNEDVEFLWHYVDLKIERMVFERKEDWGVPLEPDAMTWAKCAEIHTYFDSGHNRRPGDEDAS